MCSEYLEKYLACGRFSVHICLMDEWIHCTDKILGTGFHCFYWQVSFNSYCGFFEGNFFLWPLWRFWFKQFDCDVPTCILYISCGSLISLDVWIDIFHWFGKICIFYIFDYVFLPHSLVSFWNLCY